MAPFTYCLVAFLLLFQQAWFAAGDGDVCDTVTETRTMLAGTTVSDRDSFTNSLNSVYSTPHITGKVIFYSSLMTYPGGSFTAYAVYNPDALTSAGYSFSSETVVVTHCPDPEPTASALMPSPVSSGSEPQGDHGK
ncbi:hypothetical protein UCREL1_2510 [Eutypa lata UCREL1]|uniref:Uncharacterized protein n=1 Tax=Eutypa lata (strain UCR-EL1) TaxID=1287681 RepID=M7T0T2_EUTLA|nr:hypothetical protein UCREL1_2510 [Eutypa lata UCREL1]